jgi:hypothetical protein
LNIAFKIPPVVSNINDCHLLMELGNETMSFLIYKQNPFVVEAVYMHYLEKNTTGNDFATQLQKIVAEETILASAFASVKIYYNSVAASLVPSAYFVEEQKENILNLIYGNDKTAYCFKENVQGDEMKLLYRVPEKIYDTVIRLFPKNNFAHATSAQLSYSRNDKNILECMVYDRSIKALLFKEGKLQIVQFFEYNTPLDVSYHLLNVCQQFGVDVNEVQLLLSGMIEVDSNLYQDIFKYFLNISFTTIPTDVSIAADFAEIPAHYYTNLILLAQCE